MGGGEDLEEVDLEDGDALEDDDLEDGDEDEEDGEEVDPVLDREDFSGVFSAFDFELRELSPFDFELDFDPSAFDFDSSLSLEDERFVELSFFDAVLSFALLELVLCFREELGLELLECFFLLSDSFDFDDELCLSEE